MVEIDNQSTGMYRSDDGDTKPRRLTKKMIFLLALILIAVAVVIILALIGPVPGGDISIVLSL
ncbi:MAG: hypothetical protein JW918_03240 [Anaerolineae bacterium]|nr:hypothetical protein [Anaerolineae bacterium]